MRLRRSLTLLTLVVAVSAIGVGISLAKVRTTTLKAEKISTLKVSVLGNAKGLTLYRLKPETTKHLLCTSTVCLSVWKPSTVTTKTAKVKLPKGVGGRVTLLHRGHAYQVCVGGLPLYTFAGDARKGKASGQGLKSFGGTWMVLKIKGTAQKAATRPPAPGNY